MHSGSGDAATGAARDGAAVAGDGGETGSSAGLGAGAHRSGLRGRADAAPDGAASDGHQCCSPANIRGTAMAAMIERIIRPSHSQASTTTAVLLAGGGGP